MKKSVLFIKYILTFGFLYLILISIYEFYQISQGTGTWYKGFALTWGIGFILFFILCFILFVLFVLVIWRSRYFHRLMDSSIQLRNSLKHLNWLLAIVIFIFPIYFFQYTVWGAVFYRPFIRLLLWLGSVFITAFLVEGNDYFVSWKKIIIIFILSSVFLISANFLRNAVDYPFSLTWSEGNRLWDYSMLFGYSRYKMPKTSNLSVHLDIGRQLVGGLPFIYSGLTILQERLWLAVVNIFSYLLLGWVLFYTPKTKHRFTWLLAGSWAMTFLMQGPIHTPLVVVALLVAFAWEREIWLAFVLTLIAGYIAQASRFTWMFAPAMWGILLEFSGAQIENGRLSKWTWFRSVAIGIAGLLGGVILPIFIRFIKNINTTETYIFSNIQGGMSYQQPLLWYRLFPNSTYSPGIILGLLITILPIIILLIIMMNKKTWLTHPLQKIYVLFSLLAFLVVGLIVSVKIGGGGDLHNLDMFLLGLLFCAAIAWRRGGKDWIINNLSKQNLSNYLILLLVCLPSIPFLVKLYPISFANSIGWVATLADKNPNSISSLPTKEVATVRLKQIQDEVISAQRKGEVLFMDQRQLLTFGYIKDVELIPEYEKKLMIDHAMARNEKYFIPFYKDISQHRFAMIITFPQSITFKDFDYDFNEENNMWRKWVAEPLLCYYKPLVTFHDVKIQLLIPDNSSEDCSSKLPIPITQ